MIFIESADILSGISLTKRQKMLWNPSAFFQKVLFWFSGP